MTWAEKKFLAGEQLIVRIGERTYRFEEVVRFKYLGTMFRCKLGVEDRI